jgi:uracil-DNA glycosylase
VSRRSELLAEMGLAPVWRLRKRQESGAGAARLAEGDWITLKQAVPACTACGLHKTRTQTVFGVGDEKAEWMLIGEAPGAEEDRLGDPFGGQAGKLLDNMLAALGLKRGENVYIANVLKCRPPGNRNPEPEEVAQCTPFLKQQIALIRPKLIIAMGRFAAQTLLASDASISSLRGRTYQYEGVSLIVTCHPAYLLRTLPDKAKAWADLVFAKKTMASL